MRKMLKYLSFILLFLFTFASVSSARAVDKTITFTESRYFSNNANITFYPVAGSTYKTAKLGNGTTVMAYCFNHQLEAPPINSKLTLRNLSANENKKINSFIYILNNGWNGKTWNRTEEDKNHTFTNDEKYYITQLTIWGLQGTDGGGVDLSTLTENNTRRKAIKNASIRFLRDAKANSSQSPVKMSISPTSSGLTLSSDKKYYVTSTFKVPGSGYSKYSVTLSGAPTGTQIYVPLNNVTKKSGDTINAGKDFYVRIPAANVTSNVSFTIKLKAAGSQQTLVIYEFKGNYQDIGVPVTENKTVTATATVSAKMVGALKVRKVYVNAAKQKLDLKNVVITVTNSSGAVVAKWNTKDQNPKTITNLPLGKYTIKEVSAPAGYVKSKDIQVTVQPNKTEEITLENTKTPNPIYISKQDATTGKELPGAKLVLKNSSGTKIEEWTSTTTPHVVSKQLTPGKYTLTETIAPEGYIKTTETVTFTVDNDGNVSGKVVMKNKPKSKISISKQDITTKTELPGAKLVLKNSNGSVVEEWTSGSTPHVISKALAAGTYTLTETIAPTGYQVSTETIKFTVDANGNVAAPVVMYNKPKDKTPVYISKQDATTGTELPGAHLVLKDSKGNVVEEWDSATTPHLVSKELSAGNYTLTETIAPKGYQLTTETVTFTVDSEGKVAKPVVMYNKPKENKPVYISKQDATTGSELAGAHLVLKDSLGTTIEEWTSTNSPHLVSKQLTPGKYTLTETIAPDGYIKTTETVSFTVNSDGGVDKPVVMKNKPATSVKISKQDITTSKELPGAKLTVKNAKGEIIDEWVSTTTPHYLPADLPAGKYTLIETKSPEGYGLSDEIVDFEVLDNGVPQTVVMTNSPIPVTADIPMPLIIAGIVAAVGFAGFSMVKFSKQGAEI